MPITRGRLDPNVDAAIPDEGKEGNRSRGVLRVQLQKVRRSRAEMLGEGARWWGC